MRRAALLLLLVATPAAADPLDVFGFGARASGMAGAVTANVKGAAAAHANPAGVALGENPELTIGWGYAKMGLSLDGVDAQVLDAHGADIGFALPFSLGGGMRGGFGLAAYLPDQFIARIQLIPATEPHFVLLDNDVHRVVVEPVLSLQLSPWLSIGGGVSLLADAAGSIHFDVGVVGGQPIGQGNIDVDLPTRVAPLFGVLVMPTSRLRFGVAYRGEVDLGLRLGIVANVAVAGVVTGDALIDVRALEYYTPRRLTFGLSADVTDDITVNADVAWVDWAGFRGGSPDVRILIALGITPPLVDIIFPDDNFHARWEPRAGVEWRLGRAVVRGGYSYVTTPVPSQIGLTSFADNDRHVIALGGGYTFKPGSILTKPVHLDVALQWHHLRDRLTVKDQTIFPGEAFSSGGNIIRAAATLGVEF